MRKQLISKFNNGKDHYPHTTKNTVKKPLMTPHDARRMDTQDLMNATEETQSNEIIVEQNDEQQEIPLRVRELH